MNANAANLVRDPPAGPADLEEDVYDNPPIGHAAADIPDLPANALEKKNAALGYLKNSRSDSIMAHVYGHQAH